MHRNSDSTADDPLQEILRAESRAREQVDAARDRGEADLLESRIDARRIRERGETRTRKAIESAERRCVDRTIAEIERLDRRADLDLELDPEERDRRLRELARRGADQVWPTRR